MIEEAERATWNVAKRVGDLGSASLVLIGIEANLGARGFAWANVALGLIWLVVALQIAERHRALCGGEQERFAENRGRRALFAWSRR